MVTRKTAWVVLSGLLLTSSSLAMEASNFTTTLQHHIPASSEGKMNKFYTSVGCYEGSHTLGFFFPQVLRGKTWIFWWDTCNILDNVGAGVRKSLYKDSFYGIYLYYEMPSWSNNIPRTNIGFELGHANWQSTTNIYCSAMDTDTMHQFLTTDRLVFQDDLGCSTKISWYFLEENITLFFGMAYTRSVQKEAPYSTKTTTGRLISAAIGAHHSFNDYVDFEWKINIPEAIKFFSQDAIIATRYYQLPVHLGIQLKFNHPTSNKMQKLPERYIPYHANALSQLEAY